MTALIGVDWGTTNLRAFRFDAEGRVAERRASARGAARLAPADFAAVLAEVAGDWSDGRTPVVLAGMVGSRAGWREAPYLPCPADPGALAAAALRLDTPVGPAMLVPGLSTRAPDGAADVMRGEETQLLGADIGDGTAILPGTHSKWATLAGGRITGFSTAMTGELYAVLRGHSLLGQLAVKDAPFSADAFVRGVSRALASGALARLFSARADVLLGGLAGEEVESYLSGLLIGGEIAGFPSLARATLIGGATLAERYRAALAVAGVGEVRVVDGDEAVARGLWRIGQQW